MLWFGMLAIFLVIDVALGKTSLFSTVIYVFLFGLGLYLFARNVWTSVDEAFVDGEALLLRKGQEEVRLLFDDIEKIDYVWNGFPASLIVHLRTSSILGKTIRIMLPRAFYTQWRPPDHIKSLQNKVAKGTNFGH